MDILIISHFVTLPCEKGNSRFIYLADKLCEQGVSIELVTSSFWHSEKKQRNLSNKQLYSDKYKITLLYEPGYPQNVCLKRLSSHKKFAKNLSKYLEQRKEPDLVYCAVPSLDASRVAAKYCKKNNVEFIIDIQDLWPEAFQMVFHVPILSNMAFAPMKRKANKIYSAADEIIAVSRTYADRALKVSKKCDNALVVYLGTDREMFDQCKQLLPKNLQCESSGVLVDIVYKLSNRMNNSVFLAYAGTLGSSYDIDVVFEAMRKLPTDVLQKISFIVMGDGPKRAEFENHATGLPVIFTGMLSYETMVWILSRCDIAVNPIRKGAAQSIINKHMDYAMSGLPVINTQECMEYRELLDRYNCGINCECGNTEEFAHAILKLTFDVLLREQMGKASRAMAEELFDRQNSYKEIINILI